MVYALSSYDRVKMQKQAIVIPTQNNFRKQHVKANSYSVYYALLELKHSKRKKKINIVVNYSFPDKLSKHVC